VSPRFRIVSAVAVPSGTRRQFPFGGGPFKPGFGLSGAVRGVLRKGPALRQNFSTAKVRFVVTSNLDPRQQKRTMVACAFCTAESSDLGHAPRVAHSSPVLA
jgi:hypothetical protein